MEIDDAILVRLKAYAGLTALVGQRIFPNLVPQGQALPAVTFMTVSDIKNHILTGQLALEQPMIQYTARATTKAAARAVANQIKAALNDFSGTLSGIVVQHIRLENEIQSADVDETKSGAGGGDLAKTYYVDLEYEVSFERS